LREKRTDFSGILGLLWRRGEELVENGDRPLLEELENLPYPDYESFGIERYPCASAKALPFITQRGCPYKCNFCSVPVSMGKSFRARSPESTVAELEYWYAKGWRHFQFNDDVFNFEPKRALAIAKLIVERKLEITWELYNGMRVN